jgi:hypothetical protein
MKNWQNFSLPKRDIFLSLILFLTALVLYAKCHFFVSWDLSEYLVIAKNIFIGRGCVDIQGDPAFIRPGFVFLLAGSLALSDGSLWGPVWMVIGVSSLLPVCVYLAGTKFDNFKVGLCAAILFVTSPTLLFWVPRHIDAFWPVFLFLAMVLFPAPTEGNVKLFAAASGVFAAIAMLIKPVAICFMPFAITVKILQPNKLAPWTPSVWHYLGLFLSLILILALIPEIVIGTAHGVFLHPFTLLDGVETWPKVALELLKGVYTYFFTTRLNEGIATQLSLGWLLVGSFPAALALSWRKSRNMAIPGILTLFFFPFLSIIGLHSLRLPQNLFVIGLLYICMSFMVVRIAARFTTMINRTWAGSLFLACLLILLGSGQWAMNAAGAGRATRHLWFTHTLKKNDCAITIRGNAIGAWLEKRLQPGESAMISRIPEANGAYLSQRFPKFLFRIPFVEISNYTASGIFDLNPEKIESPVLVHAFGSLSSQASLLVLNQKRMISTIREKNIKYILWDERTGGLSWLDDSPIFHARGAVKDGRSTFHIYQVNRIGSEYEQAAITLFTPQAIKYLNWVRTNFPERYQWYHERLLHYGIEPLKSWRRSDG